jgi:hypothetical protein
VIRKAHSAQSLRLKAHGNLTLVGRNPQVDSAFPIGGKRGVKIEHSKWNGALPPIDGEGQIIMCEQISPSFESLTVPQNKYCGR